MSHCPHDPDSSVVPTNEQTDSNANQDCQEFHVVGIGASAGGLEALEAFFDSMPNNLGVAFVVVQHLSPDFKSHMEDLLARHTKMKIHRVENGMAVEPDSIYLIPPKMEMVISEGKLLLTEKGKERSLSHPIDQFFRSLASDLGRYSIGVVLSGTGSDGSRGIRDIHDAGGLVIAQDVGSAKFDGMPMNAQATGNVDLVLPPAGISEAIVRYVKEGLSPEAIVTEELLAHAADGVDRIFQLLNEQHSLDFSHYKASTVGRRIQRRVDLLKLDSVEAYVNQLENDPAELNDLYKDLLIGVTKFFRDPEAFAVIEQEVVPKILNRLKNGEPVRVWVAGCATGEEAYSLAILLDEAIRKLKKRIEIKIFATDAHHVSLHAAARGVFPEEALSELSEERIQRYFRQKRDGFHVARELRRHVVFAPHNVIRDAPFTQMDMVTCRNLLIYLQPTAQKKTLSMFHFALKSSGVLFLGPSESPGELSDEFQTIDKRWRVYSKRRDIRLPIETRMPLASPLDTLGRGPITPSSAKVQAVDKSLIGTYDRLLDRKMPPSFLVNEKYEMLHTFGGAEKYLKLKSGRPTLSLLDLVQDSLKSALTGALQHAMRKQDIVKYTGLSVLTENGAENVRMTVEPIPDSVDQVTNFLVEIESVDVSDPVRDDDVVDAVDMSEMTKEKIATLESELRYSQENLQATVEEMETTNEELQATNEELVASNEELQSTNEELHSVNEELYTVNAENQRRMRELAEANEDMDNLLATTRVGVIFLDHELYIRRFTPEIARMFHLVPQDIGRSIEGFVHNLKHEEIVPELRDVLVNQREKELQVEDNAGTPFILRMLPYRSGEEVSGVVMTLINIASLREAQAGLEKFEFMAEAAVDGMLLLDSYGKICYANPAICDLLGYTRDEMLKMSVMDIDTLFDLRKYRDWFERAGKERIEPFESEHCRKEGSVFPVEISISVVTFDGNQFLFANIRDITSRVRTGHEMRLNAAAVRATQNGIIISDATAPDNPIVYVNPGFVEMTGYKKDEVLGRNCRFLQGNGTDRETTRKIRKAIEKGESCRQTILNYKKDGSEFWNDLQITPLRDEHGRLLNFVGVQSDVTEQRVVQEELEAAHTQVKEALKSLKISEQTAQQASIAKSQFVANMSHELRTPMTSVLGFADMLRADLEDPTLLDRVDTIKRNGEYLLALLNDILDLSKIEAGKLEIASEPVDIREVINDVQLLMAVRSANEGVPLSFQFLTAVPKEITGDRIRIRQILVNLISNALKFTDRGKVLVEIELVNNDTKQTTLQIRVIDTGIGMSKEEISQLFNAFSQGDVTKARKFGGAGLGLNISKRLAEGMNAWIDVASQKGKGSTFTLSIPVADRQLDNLATAKSPPADSEANPSEPAYPNLNARILLVDDRRDVWRIGKFFLERAGAEVIIAEDGRQAVDAVELSQSENLPYDLILMDMQMPIMTGQEAVKELRSRGVETPIIAMTADAMDGERDRCIQIGCNEYFAKPIDGPQLLVLCDKVLDAARPSDG